MANSNQNNEYLTVALPLSRDQELEYKHLDNYGDLVRQNFKNLLLTIPGERVMDVDFGIGLQRFLFEVPTISSPAIKSEIIRKTKRYMPFVEIREVVVESSADAGALVVRVFYAVPSVAIEEYINLSFDSEGNLLS